jgi:hypothetical protein
MQMAVGAILVLNGDGEGSPSIYDLYLRLIRDPFHTRQLTCEITTLARVVITEQKRPASAALRRNREASFLLLL